ncbi:hypothetical protein HNE_3276 [Hyphomonas neptunium ATCC 15444]|uniref:Peptidase A2 domain-containing protein n=2 Tax=Hyphomonas TaxID=85 RepID=Q0BX44_HYPNA|nr:MULTISPECIES: retropepsin-like aspartic protease [Hyphomonas]ABI75485.1 hypothetical protein HNE_3276 [Hyphomonas neptunium ATCC 15444]KCZ92051.1 hypothetical protein HHI_12499 [Hyphomonas hirschiana VP5]
MQSAVAFGGWTRFCAAALALMSLCLPGDASTGRLTFPLSLNDAGYFVTPMAVNGAEEMPAIIDTAATIAMIESRAAGRAGIEVPPADEIQVPVFGLLGQREFPLIRIGSISGDGGQVAQLAAAYNNREQMPGGPLVIPATAFGGDVLDFDFPARRFTVYEGRPKGTSGSAGRGGLILEGGLMFAEVSVNGVKGRALIDTGSPFSFMNTQMARAAKAQQDDEKTQMLQGATGGAMAVSVASVKRLSVARFSVRRLNMIVADPAMFDDLGLSDEPAMLLGLDLLSLFRVQIDLRRGYLILTPKDAGPNMAINLNARDTRIPQ